MANDKVAATYHGAKADYPYRVQAYAIGHANGKGRKVPTVQDWMCAQRWGKEEMPAIKSTGEQAWGKITEDNPYKVECICLRAPADPDNLIKDQPGSHHAPVCSLYRPKPKRDWSPTKGELAFAMGIVLSIIAIFWFVTTYYPM